MRVLVIDDHPLIRGGLKLALSQESDVETVWEASNIEEAIGMLNTNKPDISILDLKLGKEDGIEIVKKARNKSIKSKFVVLTSSSKREDFYRAQQQDIDGYVLKDAYTEDIIYALRVVARGKKYFDPELIQYFNQDEQELNELTLRERDVMFLLGKGLSNLEISKKLFISENTVKKHISSIFSKLGLTHRVEAALFFNNLHINNN